MAYGSGDLASNCSYGLVSSFVLLYLTGTLGLDSAIIGSLMLASKVLDGISDVIFGTLIDRTHSKLGKARPWMLFGQVGVSLCLFLLFAIPAGSTTMQYIYFFIVYTALNAVFYTANGIAYSSLVALITKNNNERVQLGSFRFMFAVVTNIFMGFAVTGMVEKFGSGAAGWRTTALITSRSLVWWSTPSAALQLKSCRRKGERQHQRSRREGKSSCRGEKSMALPDR